ncbi:hypothetical protein [Mesorhizobium sp. CN2-181]
MELAREQARYEAALARRQQEAVDPDNRVVALSIAHKLGGVFGQGNRMS